MRHSRSPPQETGIGFSPSICGILKKQAKVRSQRDPENHAHDLICAPAADAEPPLRSELFSSDQMKLHGKTLAGSHKLGPRSIRDRLLTRLAENEDVLMGACNLLTAAVKANRRIAPAGEWLLDNFYLIEETIRAARRHLPEGDSREPPRLP